MVSGLSKFVLMLFKIQILYIIYIPQDIHATLPCCSNDPKILCALLLSGVPYCGQYSCPFRKLTESIIGQLKY